MIGSNMVQTALMMGLTNNICLYDVFSAEGVAEEMRQSGFGDVNIVATTDVAEAFMDAKYLISSGGAPRKEGMTREDLLKGNCEIAEQLGKDIKTYCPDVKHVVIIFNPADLTGLVTLLYSGLKPSQVTTLAALDSTRLQSALAKKFGVMQSEVKGCATYGGHGEQMAVFGSKVTIDGRKLALDQRLVNPMLPSDPNSKAAKCTENVFDIWQRTADQHSTQMIFCDLSTPKDDGTFSVYDDIRAKLLELGIPENEIAFIHNAKSEVQKKDLFGKVRSGQVRILLGSTQRMGAGTNCQQKLIALHHLDCPWRPSDLQQREGRIIRQGNENPEVDIYSYVTEGTFDAYLYQLVESKQKFISQIMTSKSPVRSAEDVDEQALSYAEIKALASGNPMIKEKMDLDIEVSKLKLLKANHLSQKYALEDAISKGFPKQIAETQARIAGYGADIATVKENTHPNGDGFSPLTLAGVTHADKKEAGAALLTMCQTMLSPEATQVGSYRGLTLELSFDTFAREYRLTMIGQLRHTVTLGTDVFGNLQRMDNALEGLPLKEQTCREQLSNLQTQLETAKAEVQKPFPREAELNTKTARLEELNTLLNLDRKEPEIVDAEPDEDQRPPERRRPQLER